MCAYRNMSEHILCTVYTYCITNYLPSTCTVDGLVAALTVMSFMAIQSAWDEIMDVAVWHVYSMSRLMHVVVMDTHSWRRQCLLHLI